MTKHVDIHSLQST